MVLGYLPSLDEKKSSLPGRRRPTGWPGSARSRRARPRGVRRPRHRRGDRHRPGLRRPARRRYRHHDPRRGGGRLPRHVHAQRLEAVRQDGVHRRVEHVAQRQQHARRAHVAQRHSALDAPQTSVRRARGSVLLEGKSARPTPNEAWLRHGGFPKDWSFGGVFKGQSPLT